MNKRLNPSSKPTLSLPPDYAPLRADIKARVQAARIKAGLAADRELLALYWDIGRMRVLFLAYSMEASKLAQAVPVLRDGKARDIPSAPHKFFTFWGWRAVCTMEAYES
jgi:hypothetical protein